MSVLIFAGHNEIEKGVEYKDVFEHDVAALWCRILYQAHEDFYKETPFLKIGKNGTLSQKIKEINTTENIEYAIDLHFNTTTAFNRSIKGSRLLYLEDDFKSYLTALVLQEKFGKLFPPNRGIKPGFFVSEATKKHRPLIFLSETKVPSFIFEPCFIQDIKQILAFDKEKALQFLNILKETRDFY